MGQNLGTNWLPVGNPKSAYYRSYQRAKVSNIICSNYLTGSILQQIALTASGQQGLTVPQLAPTQQDLQPRERTTNHTMSLRVNPHPPAIFEEEIEAPQTKSKKRSRKQYLPPAPRLSDSLPSIDNNPPQKTRGRGRKQNFTILKPMEAVVVEVEETVPNNTQQTKSSRRKRKSPVRSTMADILGEPEFVETFYLEESDNDEGESHGTNVSEKKKLEFISTFCCHL